MKDDIEQDMEAETGESAESRAVERIERILQVRPLNTSGDEEEWLLDLLTDLRHWARAQEVDGEGERLDFDHVAQRSELHYSLESDDEDEPDEEGSS